MWFRRDLRLNDNAALYHALKSEYHVLPVFIFDKNILDDLEDKKDMRVEFIRDALEEMQTPADAKEWLNNKRPGPFLAHGRERAFNLVDCGYHQRLKFHPQSFGCLLRFLDKELVRRIRCVGQEGHA